MKIHSSTSHLTAIEQRELQIITEGLKVFMDAEIIFCYGSRLGEQTNRSCFTRKRRAENTASMYDLVIIVNDKNPCGEDELREMAGWLKTRNCSTHIIVHKAGFVKDEIRRGNFFFIWLYRSAIILYDKDNSWTLYKDQLSRPDCLKRFDEAQTKANRLLQRAESCLMAAAEQKDPNNSGIIPALYNQALMYACKGVILGCLGYAAAQNDTGYLINCTLNFTEGIAALFPRHTEAEEAIFCFLTGTTTPYSENDYHFFSEEDMLKVIHHRVSLAIGTSMAEITHSSFIH